MTTLKEMPTGEKYALTLANMKLAQSFAVDFVREHISGEAVDELRDIWRQGVAPVPDAATDAEKYEIAYRNWAWVAKNNFRFVRRHMGREGLATFIRADVEALKREYENASLRLLALVRAVSPGLAFSMTMSRMIYQLQWLTPFSVAEPEKNTVVCSIPRCKVLDYDGMEDVCEIGCQVVYPAWTAEQFKVKMSPMPRGHSCVVTLTPIR